MKLAYAALVVALLFFIYPAAKYWLRNSPKAERGDWQAFLLPLGLVVLFVAGLMWIVGR